MKYVYEVTQNSDLMEGKGRQESCGYFADEYEALRRVEMLPTDMGGQKSAMIWKVPVFSSIDEWQDGDAQREVIWGYRKTWTGKWDEGWHDWRDAPTHDPEFQEFQRLLKKFGGGR